MIFCSINSIHSKLLGLFDDCIVFSIVALGFSWISFILIRYLLIIPRKEIDPLNQSLLSNPGYEKRENTQLINEDEAVAIESGLLQSCIKLDIGFSVILVIITVIQFILSFINHDDDCSTISFYGVFIMRIIAWSVSSIVLFSFFSSNGGSRKFWISSIHGSFGWSLSQFVSGNYDIKV